MSTCYFCKTKVKSNQFRELTMCPCGLFGIDYGENYVRFVGSIPAEDLTAAQQEQYDETLRTFRASELARFRKLNDAEVLRECGREENT